MVVLLDVGLYPVRNALTVENVTAHGCAHNVVGLLLVISLFEVLNADATIELLLNFLNILEVLLDQRIQNELKHAVLNPLYLLSELLRVFILVNDD